MFSSKIRFFILLASICIARAAGDEPMQARSFSGFEGADGGARPFGILDDADGGARPFNSFDDADGGARPFNSFGDADGGARPFNSLDDADGGARPFSSLEIFDDGARGIGGVDNVVRLHSGLRGADGNDQSSMASNFGSSVLELSQEEFINTSFLDVGEDDDSLPQQNNRGLFRADASLLEESADDETSDDSLLQEFENNYDEDDSLLEEAAGDDGDEDTNLSENEARVAPATFESASQRHGFFLPTSDDDQTGRSLRAVSHLQVGGLPELIKTGSGILGMAVNPQHGAPPDTFSGLGGSSPRAASPGVPQGAIPQHGSACHASILGFTAFLIYFFSGL